MGFNDRQIKAVMHMKEEGKITNTGYQEIANVSKPTATRDLSELVRKNILEQIGITGRGTQYILKGSQTAQTTHKGLTNGSNR